jgi:DNA-binding NarL/FixJ family response regulator
MTRILIVDDHAAFRFEARLLLEATGFDVVGEAADGRSALVAALALRPDAILLDIGLPDTNGFAVSGELETRGVDARIVLTSSRDAATYEERVQSSAVAGFVRKDELNGEVLISLLGQVSDT